jgi:hypothetical protein
MSNYNGVICGNQQYTAVLTRMLFHVKGDIVLKGERVFVSLQWWLLFFPNDARIQAAERFVSLKTSKTVPLCVCARQFGRNYFISFGYPAGILK